MKEEKDYLDLIRRSNSSSPKRKQVLRLLNLINEIKNEIQDGEVQIYHRRFEEIGYIYLRDFPRWLKETAFQILQKGDKKGNSTYAINWPFVYELEDIIGNK